MDKATFKNKFRPRVKVIEVPEIGESVYIRMMSAAARIQLFLENKKREKDGETADQAQCRLVAYALCDKDGNRLFSDEEIGELVELDGPLMDKIVREWLTFNGLGAAAESEKEKNS